MNLQRTKVIYSGRVQGVGFRYTTARISRSHPVTGYVMNLPDGCVELVAEGDLQDLKGFLAAVRDRLAENIESEDQTVVPATGEFSVFEIRHYRM